MAKYPYNNKRWSNLRKAKLASDPLCHYCAMVGKITAADTVDHIKPHKLVEELIWDWSNLMSLCKSCHDNAAQMKDSHGYVPGVGVDGLPLDVNHPWNNAGDIKKNN